MSVDTDNYAVYNPHDGDVDDLPVIYGFNNGEYGFGDFHGQLVSEDGYVLGSHICSSEGFMYGDLGILEGHRADRHETFREYYPDGYRMDFVSYNDVPDHQGLNAAFAANEELNDE